MYESLTISIPLFNEEESISNLYNEIIDVLSSIQKDRIAKLLLVNDGSTDNTAKLLDKYFSEVQDCQIIHHNENKNLDGFLKPLFFI